MDPPPPNIDSGTALAGPPQGAATAAMLQGAATAATTQGVAQATPAPVTAQAVSTQGVPEPFSTPRANNATPTPCLANFKSVKSTSMPVGAPTPSPTFRAGSKRPAPTLTDDFDRTVTRFHHTAAGLHRSIEQLQANQARCEEKVDALRLDFNNLVKIFEDFAKETRSTLAAIQSGMENERRVQRGEAAQGRGAGGTASPPVAPQPRKGLQESVFATRGTAATGRGADGAAPPLEAPQPGIGKQKGPAMLSYAAVVRPASDDDGEWQTSHSKKQKSQAKQLAKQSFVPAKDLPLEVRCLIFTRRADARATPKPINKITAAVNIGIYLKGAPNFHRLTATTRNTKGTITATTASTVDAQTLINHYRHEIIDAARKVDNAILDVQVLETWVKLKVHGISLNRFMGKGTHSGIHKLPLEIAAENNGIQALAGVRWLGNPRNIRHKYRAGTLQKSSAVFSVKSSKAADHLIAHGVTLGGIRYKVDVTDSVPPDLSLGSTIE
jgi:hypothetical protein